MLSMVFLAYGYSDLVCSSAINCYIKLLHFSLIFHSLQPSIEILHGYRNILDVEPLSNESEHILRPGASEENMVFRIQNILITHDASGIRDVQVQISRSLSCEESILGGQPMNETCSGQMEGGPDLVGFWNSPSSLQESLVATFNAIYPILSQHRLPLSK